MGKKGDGMGQAKIVVEFFVGSLDELPLCEDCKGRILVPGLGLHSWGFMCCDCRGAMQEFMGLMISTGFQLRRGGAVAVSWTWQFEVAGARETEDGDVMGPVIEKLDSEGSTWFKRVMEGI